MAVLALALVAPASAITVYSLDDGTGESQAGRAGGGSLMWLNRFVVQAGGTMITSISGAFGNVPNGAAITAHLWSDPNQDGKPFDSISVASSSSVIANANTDTFVTFNIPKITMVVGTSFFAGFRMSHAGNMWPARLDTSSNPAGHSWIVAGNNQNSLGTAQNLLTDSGLIATNAAYNFTGQAIGNWMVRATAVPEPGSMIALGLGAAALLRRRAKSRA